jgi:hypothetical protein
MRVKRLVSLRMVSKKAMKRGEKRKWEVKDSKEADPTWTKSKCSNNDL